jgi:WD40 repeat protein
MSFRCLIRVGLVALPALLVLSPVALSRPAAPGRAEPAGNAKLDLNGEPIPPGAIARVGTVRFRHGGPVTQIAFSPDGRTVYTACIADRVVRTWSVSDGREIRRVDGASSFALSPDGRLLVSGGVGTAVSLRETSTWDELRKFMLPAEGAPVANGRIRRQHVGVAGVGFAQGGKAVVTVVPGKNEAIVWDTASGTELRRLGPDGASPMCVSGDGRRAAFGGIDGRASIWDVATGNSVQTLGPAGNAGESRLTAFSLSRDGKLLAASHGVAAVKLWDVDTGKEQRTVQAPAEVHALAFTPSGTALVVAYDDGDEVGGIEFVDPAAGAKVRELDGPARGVTTLAFSADGKTLATAGEGNTVRIWDAATGKEIGPSSGHPGAITTVALGADGRLLATCSVHDKAIRIWETATGRELRQLDGHPTGVDEVTFSPDGKLLASARWNHAVIIWDVATGNVLHTLKDHPAVGAYLRFADDSKTLATGGRGNAIALWDCATGRLLSELHGPPNGLASLLTFHNGRLFAHEQASTEEDNDSRISLWDVTANRVARQFSGHQGRVNGVILSADGRMLASRGADKTIRVWEVATGEERRRFQEPGAIQQTGAWTGTQFLTFEPGGRALVTCATDDPFARRWDLATGKELPPLAGHHNWVGAVEFSANGKILVTGSQDTTALVWDGKSIDSTPAAPAAPTDAEVARYWGDLADRDASKAYSAVLALTRAGDRGVSAVSSRLKATAATDPAKVSEWIAALDDPQFQTREKATAALVQVADQIGTVLRAELGRTRSAEVRQRIQRILDMRWDVAAWPDLLREVRAVEVLESVGTPAAWERLMALAHGPAGATLTREAAAALRRLDGRATP